MARIELNHLISSASGVISRRRMSDGTVQSIVVNKRGRMYQTTYRPKTVVPPAEKARRQKFGVISSAFAMAQKELQLPADPETRKKAYAVMGGIFDRMAAHGKTATAEQLATMYAYSVW